jgi:RNA polymerase sigma-70 factor (ECF subfamily)
MGMPLDLEQLYEEHAPALFSFVLNLTRNEADTRDVLQEVFVKLARRPELFEGVKSPRGFLLRLAHNQAIDLMRRNKVREKTSASLARELENAFASSDDPDEQAFRTGLMEAMGELPPDQRAVMHLKLWERLTFDQIADLLHISPNTVASRYRYGLDKLRERLRPYYDELN